MGYSSREIFNFLETINESSSLVELVKLRVLKLLGIDVNNSRHCLSEKLNSIINSTEIDEILGFLDEDKSQDFLDEVVFQDLELCYNLGVYFFEKLDLDSAINYFFYGHRQCRDESLSRKFSIYLGRSYDLQGNHKLAARYY